MAAATMTRNWWAAAALVGAVVLGGGLFWLARGRTPTTGGTPEDLALFRDVTARSGVDHTYRNGEEAGHFAILESLGGGVALFDYDGDGKVDIFLTGGGYFDGKDKKEIKGHPCKLYRNRGNFQFEDVTAKVGLDRIAFYTHGCAVADYNRDGRPDLLVTGYGRLALFKNVEGPDGQRRFEEVTDQARLLGKHFWSTSAAWADFDGDGYPDLYVCQYVNWSFANHEACPGYSPEIERDVCPPGAFDARPHALYRNNGDGTFTDVSREAGLRTERSDKDYDKLTFLDKETRDRLRAADHERDFGKGLGVVAVDVNGDGRPDIYVANDTTDKLLYLNRSAGKQLRFEEKGYESGAARDAQGGPNGSMGVDAGDYDGSGRPSFVVTNYQNEYHALYRLEAPGDVPHFVFDSMATGLTGLGRSYVGFGTGFFDYDLDGWQDVVIANGHVIRYPSGSAVRQRSLLLRNEGRKEGKNAVRFTDMGDQGGVYFQALHQGRGLAIGDLDNDGRPDLVISHMNAPVVLLRNEAGKGNHWLGVQLADKTHRDFVGARLTLEVGPRTLTRFAKGGGSYLSSGDRRHLFGLGAAGTVGRLTVTWPWGQKDTWEGLAVDRYWRLTAGDKAPVDLSGADRAGQ